jgi:integrase
VISRVLDILPKRFARAVVFYLTDGAYRSCTGKGRKQRYTPLTRQTATILRAWLGERRGQPGEPLFPDQLRPSPQRAAERSRAFCSVASSAFSLRNPASSACSSSLSPPPSPFSRRVCLHAEREKSKVGLVDRHIL